MELVRFNEGMSVVPLACIPEIPIGVVAVQAIEDPITDEERFTLCILVPEQTT